MHRVISILLSVSALMSQGCVVWRYPTTPAASGQVVDAVSGVPIGNARVGFRDHERVATLTAANGNFALKGDHRWGPAFIIPLEFVACGGAFFVEAPGYAPFEKDLGQWAYGPPRLPEPIKLSRQTAGKTDKAAESAANGPAS